MPDGVLRRYEERIRRLRAELLYILDNLYKEDSLRTRALAALDEDDRLSAGDRRESGED